MCVLVDYSRKVKKDLGIQPCTYLLEFWKVFRMQVHLVYMKVGPPPTKVSLFPDPLSPKTLATDFISV